LLWPNHTKPTVFIAQVSRNKNKNKHEEHGCFDIPNWHIKYTEDDNISYPFILLKEQFNSFREFAQYVTRSEIHKDGDETVKHMRSRQYFNIHILKCDINAFIIADYSP